MKDGTYIVIQSFMRSELKLKGNELLAYAIIHGFSQDGEDWFTGSRSYIAEWLGVSKKTVTNVLQSLTEKGLIERREIVVNNVTFVDYRSTYPLGKKLPHPREKTSPHNIDNNNLYMLGTDKTINEEVNQEDIWESVENNVFRIKFSVQCLKVYNDTLKRDLYSMPSKAAECLNLREGRYTLEEIAGMIKMKRDEWQGTKMESFLKPSTLFSPDHFDEYMDAYRHQNDEREFSDDEIPY